MTFGYLSCFGVVVVFLHYYYYLEMENMLPIVVKVLAPILAGRKTDDPVYLNFHFHYLFSIHMVPKKRLGKMSLTSQL